MTGIRAIDRRYFEEYEQAEIDAMNSEEERQNPNLEALEMMLKDGFDPGIIDRPVPLDKMTVRISRTNMALLEAMGARFNESKTGFCESLLDDVIVEAFESLSISDMESVASRADEILETLIRPDLGKWHFRGIYGADNGFYWARIVNAYKATEEYRDALEGNNPEKRKEFFEKMMNEGFIGSNGSSISWKLKKGRK